MFVSCSRNESKYKDREAMCFWKRRSVIGNIVKIVNVADDVLKSRNTVCMFFVHDL